MSPSCETLIIPPSPTFWTRITSSLCTAGFSRVFILIKLGKWFLGTNKFFYRHKKSTNVNINWNRPILAQGCWIWLFAPFCQWLLSLRIRVAYSCKTRPENSILSCFVLICWQFVFDLFQILKIVLTNYPVNESVRWSVDFHEKTLDLLFHVIYAWNRVRKILEKKSPKNFDEKFDTREYSEPCPNTTRKTSLKSSRLSPSSPPS